jgi:hypothetical protein
VNSQKNLLGLLGREGFIQFDQQPIQQKDNSIGE